MPWELPAPLTAILAVLACAAVLFAVGALLRRIGR
jgi:hypothetical protein